ncbi:CRISPR-associated helicase Cas3' [SAR202 cluster bacterium AD-804-J14_MRT_500m]|nr:CRISPR-associated helicase Cas3' [SAR202 cluster bacterium AD-804-J14_MRT_500m]
MKILDENWGRYDHWKIAGKFSGDSRYATHYHPLAYHLLDVAAVVEILWQQILTPRVRSWLAESFQGDPDQAGKWVSFLAGLHDLGKASPIFQIKDSAAHNRLAGTALELVPRDLARKASTRHEVITAYHLQNFLPQFTGVDKGIARSFAIIAGGHHGIFPSIGQVRKARGFNIGEPDQSSGNNPWQEARNDLLQCLQNTLDVPCESDLLAIKTPKAMLLSGLISVCDWIGSNTDYFPFVKTEYEPTDYMERFSRPQAENALGNLGWLATPIAQKPRSFAGLFPGIEKPNHLQQLADELSDSLCGPTLIVIEAPTGEGKTEAALTLADRLISNGSTGLYIALPTQATSNQIYARLKDFLADRYSDSPIVNSILLHGHSSISGEMEILENMTPEEKPVDLNDSYNYEDLTSVGAAEWFTYRKRGLLAPFGAGTIDQILLGVLQVRHGFVRIFGLANKVVVIDEVHAYDTYMSELLQQLLRWLAAIDASVILLSATLPYQRRRSLMDAYGQGLNKSQVMSVDSEYPRISWIESTGSETKYHSKHVFTSSLNTRQIVLEKAPTDFSTIGDNLETALSAGGCAAVICNTVDRAQEMYKELRKRFTGKCSDGDPEIQLLHSRFLFKDRQRLEQRVLRRYGKPGDSSIRPDRSILVATQIIEQSLDLDFDLMVSDIAPIDCIIQRAGRLQRHQRDNRNPSFIGKPPHLWVMWPGEASSGIPTFDRGTTFVYAEHVLLRTWLELKGMTSISVPDQIDELINAVYHDHDEKYDQLSPALNDYWDDTAQDLDKRRASERAEAKDRWLKSPTQDIPLWKFYEQQLTEDDPDFHTKLQALTRLTGNQVSLVILYRIAGALHLSPDDPRIVPIVESHGKYWDRELLKNSVTLGSPAKLVNQLKSFNTEPLWSKSRYFRHHRLVIVDEHGSAECSALRIDPDLGIQEEKNGSLI